MADRGLLADIETLHLDRGYDSAATIERCQRPGLTDVICAKKRKPGEPKTPKTPKNTKKAHTPGLRWPAERTNSWLSNFGQLRRNTDRYPAQRLGQIALILTVKLVKWAKRWND